MQNFQLFAEPWWVNLVILVPFAVYYFWRKGLHLSGTTLAVAAVFSAAFGLVEAAAVVYLRVAIGFVSGQNGNLQDITGFGNAALQQSQILSQLPQSLFAIEVFREAATIVILASVALLAAKMTRERLAVFLWTFALWDIFYYVGFFFAIGWPSSPTTPDVLFLIPVPWYAQVWFPILVSILAIVAVLLAIQKTGKNL